MAITLLQLQSDVEVRKLLAWPFDFELPTAAVKADWFQIRPEAETSVIAQDGTGGLFLLYGTEQHLLHITSEGAAGVIAHNLTEGIALMVAHPNWRDVLKFSAGGKLVEMRRAHAYFERELHEEEPEIDSYRSILKERLSLGESGDQIAALHRAVSVLGEGITVVAPDGTEFDSLFNTFSVKSNPAWNEGE